MSIADDIYEQHVQEASFLWLLRDGAVLDPSYDLADLSELDERVEAHLDGLRLGGDAAWAFCESALEEVESGEAFVAASLAVHRGDLRGIAHVLDVAGADPQTARGIASAIGWAPLASAKRILAGLLFERCPPSLHYLGVAGSAAHRTDPGGSLGYAIYSQDIRLKARALRAVGECRKAELLQDVVAALSSTDEACRFAAGWSAALLGETTALPVLWSLARSSRRYGERACDMLVRRLELGDANQRLNELRYQAGSGRAGIVGAAALGDPANVPWLVDSMERDPQLARLAASAFTTITGLGISGAQFEGEQPDGFDAAPSDDPADEDVSLDPDESLPWPNVAEVSRWWHANSGRFQSGTRYVLGKAMTDSWLERVLREGSQPVRAAATLELSLRQEGRLLEEVRAPGFRQQRSARAS